MKLFKDTPMNTTYLKRNWMIFLFITTTCLRGQNSHDYYEIKIGNYDYKTINESSLTANKPKPISIKIQPYEVITQLYDENGNVTERKELVDHFDVVEIFDSSNVEASVKKLSSELEVYWKGHKSRVEGVFICVYRPIGEPYCININSAIISKSEEAMAYIKDSPANTYIQIRKINFFPVRGKSDIDYISDGFAFKIIN